MFIQNAVGYGVIEAIYNSNIYVDNCTFEANIVTRVVMVAENFSTLHLINSKLLDNECSNEEPVLVGKKHSHITIETSQIIANKGLTIVAGVTNSYLSFISSHVMNNRGAFVIGVDKQR